MDNELRVTAAVADLSPDYREVIVLRNLQRLSFNEVLRAAHDPARDEEEFVLHTRKALGALLAHASREDRELVPLVRDHLEAVQRRFEEREAERTGG